MSATDKACAWLPSAADLASKGPCSVKRQSKTAKTVSAQHMQLEDVLANLSSRRFQRVLAGLL